MSTEILTALISLGGSLVGTFAGILASAKMTAYRIEQLEKKVDEHNEVAMHIPVLEERVEEHGRRIEKLEETIDDLGKLNK